LEPVWNKAEEETAGIALNDEDVLTYILFPQVALKFFENRKNKIENDVPQITSSDEVGEELIHDELPSISKKPIKKLQKRPIRGGDDEMNIDEIRELILLLDQTSVTDLEVQKDDYRLSLKKSGAANTTPAVSGDTASTAASRPAEDTAGELPMSDNVTEILSPMVGTFYASPSPDSEPFVSEGEHVEAGKTLCILEAMKLFNEIKSDFSGTVVKVLVENGEPVEYGQILFLIEKD